MGSLGFGFLRTGIQLLVLGWGLRLVMDQPHELGTLGFILVLIEVTSQFIYSRLEVPLTRLEVTGSVVLTVFPALYGIGVVIRPQPWYSPQYWVPMVGLGLGAVVPVAIQVANGFWRELQQCRSQVETHLCLGATPEQALAPWGRSVLSQLLQARAQQLRAVALVVLPLFLAGQVLAGVNPLVGVAYEGLGVLISLMSAVMMARLMLFWVGRRVWNRERSSLKFD